MTNMTATFSISPEMIDLAETVQRNLVLRILPNAMSKAVPIVRAAIQAEIIKSANGQVGDPPSRSKQSAKARARFPYHMKDRVRVRHVSDEAGVLKVVGVDNKAAHVNFDHGEKAKTSGRVHKLWWVKGVREVYATPKLRKQTKDIPRIVADTVSAQVLDTMEASIRGSISAGELV